MVHAVSGGALTHKKRARIALKIRKKVDKRGQEVAHLTPTSPHFLPLTLAISQKSPKRRKITSQPH